jgi:DNA-binding XRE family transcriptional regulator
MEKKTFAEIRSELGKTQKEMAQLLGSSIKAVQSMEQGWRNIPTHTERQILFLLAKKKGHRIKKPCWVQKDCPKERREDCPAWEFRCGDLCWFINGTICKGEPQQSWEKKIRKCRRCNVYKEMFDLNV